VEAEVLKLLIMKPIMRFSAFILLTGLLFNISCQKELSCENCKGNKPPIANAGPNQVITLPTDSVSLDGSSSSDPDGSISNCLWSKISGPASFIITNPPAIKTVVKNLAAGVYQFELKVTDNKGSSAKDSVQVIVIDPAHPNRSPVANAGPDQTITLLVSTINLDGSASFDPDNNITAYTWTKISGPSSFNIVNANAVQTQVTNLAQGTYQFEVKVTDAGMLFSKDTMQVTVSITQPDPCSVNRPLINAQLIPFGTLSYARRGMSVASAGNKILFAGGYVFGGGVGSSYDGFSRVDIYDIVTHNWSTAELSIARFKMGVAVSGNKIFFAGGANAEYGGGFFERYSNVDIYDASANSWSVDSLSEPTDLPEGAAVGDKVFFAEGLAAVDIYNLSTNSWSAATLSEARGSMSAVTANNKIYFAGGTSDSTLVSNRIDIYDNATSSWSTSSLIEGRDFMASIAFAGKIYWAGGWISNEASSQVEIKDVNTQTSSLACLFHPNANFDAVVKDNKIVFFTGEGPGFIAGNKKFDIYDVTTNTWSIGVLPVDITGASIISVNNTIYVAGGYVNGVLSNKVWKLDF
jgi:hypothetical protein